MRSRVTWPQPASLFTTKQTEKLVCFFFFCFFLNLNSLAVHGTFDWKSTITAALKTWKRGAKWREKFLLGRGKYRQIAGATISIYHFLSGLLCIVVVGCGCFCIFSDPWENGKLGKLPNWFAAAPSSSRLHNFQGSIIISSGRGGLLYYRREKLSQVLLVSWLLLDGGTWNESCCSCPINWNKLIHKDNSNEMIHHTFVHTPVEWFLYLPYYTGSRFSMIPLLADESGAIFENSKWQLIF